AHLNQPDVRLARVPVNPLTPGPAGPTVVNATPSVPSLAGPVGSVDITFSRAMDAASFTVAADVLSFAGPSGSLLGQITGSSWINSTTLRITFTPQTAAGTYQLVLGPQVTAAGVPLDDNLNGVAGEAADQYPVTFTIN